MGPVIDSTNEDVVHHVIVYECETLSVNEAAFRGVCEDPNMPTTLEKCRNGKVLAMWARGGSEYDFPPNVAMPFKQSKPARKPKLCVCVCFFLIYIYIYI